MIISLILMNFVCDSTVILKGIPLTPTFCSVQVTDQKNNTTLPFDERNGKISTQPHTTLCIQFLDRQNNDKNNTRPLRKQICFTIVWGYVEILPKK